MDRPDPKVAADSILEAQRLLQPLAGRARVWLFGSWARGDAHRGSDIDIAVLPKEPLPEGLLAELRERFEESTIPYRVDLVDLSIAEKLFRDRVEREGIAWID